MNNDVLQAVLNELVEEVKEIHKDVLLNNKTVEVYTESINKFEEHLKNISVNVSPPDLKPIEQIINYRLNEIKEILKNQSKEVIYEKRILFYPEGDGRNFLKFIADRLLRYVTLLGGICLLVWIGLYYWKINSENERYKYAYLWILYEQDIKTQNYLIENLLDFTNDSLISSRKEVIKQIENKIKVKPR
jgi:hypothetical protein